MLDRVSNLARRLTEVSVRRPGLTVLLGLGLTAVLLFQASRLTSEVGYAAYFGPNDPAVERLSDFFEEFDSGLHVLVVLGCPGSAICSSIKEQSALEFIGRLQGELDRLPNVRRTQSVLNAPIVVGPLETRTIAGRSADGAYTLAGDWPALVERSVGEPFLANVVVSADATTAGIIVELQSIESQPVRQVVHQILDLVPRYEKDLGRIGRTSGPFVRYRTLRQVRCAAPPPICDLFLASEIATAPIVSPRARKRLAAEIAGTLELYDRSGWLDEPAGYHAAPPPLEVSNFDERPARLLNYRHMRFESGFEPHPEAPGRERWLANEPNRTGHAWLLKHPGPQRPWLVCIPGYRMGHPLVDFTAFRAHWVHRTLGINVAIPVMPLHGPRRVKGARGGDGFFTGDFVDTLHAQAQAVWDIRRLVAWLRAQGAPVVGTHGVSLGGYTAALHASLDDGIDCAIVGIPASDFSKLLESHVPDVLVRTAKRIGITFDNVRGLLRVVSPFAFTPKLPRERRFVYAGLADQLTTPDHARDLWQHWGQPRAAWYQGGHVSSLWQAEVRDLIHEALVTSGMIRGQLPEAVVGAA